MVDQKDATDAARRVIERAAKGSRSMDRPSIWLALWMVITGRAKITIKRDK